MILWIIGFVMALIISLVLIKAVPPLLRWLGGYIDNALEIPSAPPERVIEAKERVKKLKVEKTTLMTEVSSDKKSKSLKREISSLEGKLTTKE